MVEERTAAGRALDLLRPADEVLRAASPTRRAALEADLAAFAKLARALFGYERLPEPIVAWATLGPSDVPGLRRLLPEGRFEFRAFEGRLTLLRRPASTGIAGLREVFERLLGRGLPEARALPGSGSTRARFERPLPGFVSADATSFEGKTFAFTLTPDRVPRARDVAHEERSSPRRGRRPPGPEAIPGPPLLRGGGRYAKDLRPARRRPAR